jgi:hypothetical protein
MFTDRERATVLAALRFWQCRGPVITSRPASPLSAETWWQLHDIATDCGNSAPLKDNEIDQVCARLNAPDELRATSLRSLGRKLIETIGRWVSFVDLHDSRASFKSPAYRCRPRFADNEPKDPAEETELDDTYCDCQLPGFFCSGIPGIVAHVENGRLSATAKVERCDACLRYPSDEAALKKLRELGF